MTRFKKWFLDEYPICKETLMTDRTNLFLTHIKKSCPNGHFEKEFLPALESFVETVRS